MKSLLATIALIFATASALTAQHVELKTEAEYKHRFSFAKIYFGLDYLSSNGGTTAYLNKNLVATPIGFEGYKAPRLLWGATHFWGHADIYVAFPLGRNTQKVPSPFKKISFNNSIETGFKIYPSALTPNTLRPYIGASWMPVSFVQQVGSEAGLSLSKNLVPILAGVSYASKRFIFEAGIQYFPKNKFEYAIDRNVNGSLILPNLNINVGFKYTIETTDKPIEKIKAKYEAIEKRKKYNGFYLGIGPSASFGVQTFSEFDKVNYPFLESRKRYPGFFTDKTLGYYFHKPDVNVGLSFRNMKEGYEALGVQHVAGRQSFMFETYKFLGDYHGFVPFVGPTISYEKMNFNNRDLRQGSDWQTYNENKFAVGIIFGWDIRPTRAEWWILRTNLRYTPVSMKVEGKKVNFDHLEFNFIQFTMFPGRLAARLLH